MGDKEDYLTSYRVFFETFAATVNPEDQLPVHIAGYTITEAELPGEVLYWTTQYLTEKQCPPTLMTPLRRIILDEVRAASKKQPNDFGYKSDESVYIALRLMQAVTARVIDVCFRYLDNSKLDSLPPPPPLSQRDLKTVSCATKNSRRVMEDRHVEIGNLEALFGIETTESTSFYAVYDGHAGSAAATYCAAHLHQYLVESPHFKTDLQRAMRDAFLRTDADFVRKSDQERACGGSTAVTVAVRGRQLLAAWAGDSLALLAKRMRLMQLVRPHKPGRQDERDRIESSGGTVMYWGTWRVNGQLAVSRAIGDAQYKPYVTARPEIATVDLDGDEDFVVVACDGLWDFVSEDDVALAVYRQLALDPHDLKAVTKRLVVQAKRQGSADNISIIVVFLKDPRDVAADNCPPMELGLDNVLANAPPFAMEPEACKRPLDNVGGVQGAVGECADADADNGLDNSDSDSEDLGPETAVDADDVDAERNQPAAPTPPADAVEEGHVDGALVDNVAESGEESEEEWNYFKGEGEREHDPSEEPDEPQRSPTPCQDNSAWETSSVDMNSSPLNPDAPVFVPGSVGTDVLLAESPRKPLPMDDIELPDAEQFKTEAVVRPAELLDLDNCDQLNGHHNISLDEAGNEHMNGNDKCNMDSLGFGFGAGVESEKITDTGLIQDFERIQKDTTDFCNIQVFQTHTETNPFASDSNDELFERLKNKERDPMSMSFYQEKDDDTCERLSHKEPHIDLNAVQPLPDSDEDDVQSNGVCDKTGENEKENVSPDQHIDLIGSERDILEPNNDIIRFDCRTDILGSDDNFGQDNFMDYNVENTNVQNYCNVDFEPSNVSQNTVLQTDTPESHKLLFEQIPEIPDGKSSELGFANEDVQDPSESEKDGRAFTPQEETSQDVDMESKFDDSPCVEAEPELPSEFKEVHMEAVHDNTQHQTVSPEPIHQIVDNENEIVTEPASSRDNQVPDQFSPVPMEEEKPVAISPELPHDTQENVIVDVHRHNEANLEADDIQQTHEIDDEVLEVPEVKLESDQSYMDVPIDGNLIHTGETPVPAESPLPSQSPLPSETLPISQSPLLTQSPLPSQSPLPTESIQLSQSPLPVEGPLLSHTPVSEEILQPARSPMPDEVAAKSPTPVQSPVPVADEPSIFAPVESTSPVPSIKAVGQIGVELLLETVPTESPIPQFEEQIEFSGRSPSPAASPLPAEVPLPRESPLLSDSPIPVESPLLVESSHPIEASISREELATADVFSLVDSAPTSESPALRPDTATPIDASPAPGVVEPAYEAFEDRHNNRAVESRLTPDIPAEAQERPISRSDEIATEDAISGPTPDIVPERAPPSRGELVTDIDIGIPESRAQEICVPVTSEIHTEDGVQPGAATPPPTPAVEQPTATDPLDIPPLSETPIAADIVPAAAAAAVAVAATAATVAAAKSKTPAKKPSTTPITAKTDARTKSAPKSAASPRVPPATVAVKKSPAAATPATRPAAARTSLPATKTPTPASKATTPTAKSSTSTARTTSATKPTMAAPRTTTAKPAPITKSTSTVREPVAVKSAAAPRSAPTAAAGGRPASAPRPAASRPAPTTAPRPAPITRPAARTVPATTARPAPAPAAPRLQAKPKPVPEKKPLANGDVKEAAAPRTTTRPATTRPPIQRAPPRAPVSASAAQTAPKSAAPKPAPRATKPLDKQTKDLANKRITAKAAPPRTATAKAPTAVKGAVTKPAPKKCIDSVVKEAAAPAKEAPALTNGAAEAALSKPPPSPPAADNALLPDVIA